MDKEIRKAIRDAERAGFAWRELSGHTLGWIVCNTCGAHVQVYGTGRNPDEGAKRIRWFLRKHQHKEQR